RRVKGFNEFGGVFLEQFHDLHGRVFLGEIAQDVDVIFDATDGDGMAFEVLQDARHVCPDPGADIWFQKWAALFGGEDYVGAENMQRLRHSAGPDASEIARGTSSTGVFCD